MENVIVPIIIYEFAPLILNEINTSTIMSDKVSTILGEGAIIVMDEYLGEILESFSKNFFYLYVLNEGMRYFYYYYFFKKSYHFFFGMEKFRDILKIAGVYKNFKSNHINMKLYRQLFQLYVRSVLYFENKRTEKSKKRKEKISAYKRKNKQCEDKKREKMMVKNGFFKCECCKHYVSPEQILEDIQDKEFDENSEMCDIMFSCRKCNQPFKSDRMQHYADLKGVPALVEFLKEKREAMVYLNLPVIRYENKCV